MWPRSWATLHVHGRLRSICASRTQHATSKSCASRTSLASRRIQSRAHVTFDMHTCAGHARWLKETDRRRGLNSPRAASRSSAIRSRRVRPMSDVATRRVWPAGHGAGGRGRPARDGRRRRDAQRSREPCSQLGQAQGAIDPGRCVVPSPGARKMRIKKEYKGYTPTIKHICVAPIHLPHTRPSIEHRNFVTAYAGCICEAD